MNLNARYEPFIFLSEKAWVRVLTCFYRIALFRSVVLFALPKHAWESRMPNKQVGDVHQPKAERWHITLMSGTKQMLPNQRIFQERKVPRHVHCL